jgi:hypothetical protein
MAMSNSLYIIWQEVAESFFIRNPPKVNINPESTTKSKVNGGGKRPAPHQGGSLRCQSRYVRALKQ